MTRDIYSLSSYHYDLPQENIAQFPASPRDSSRLLVWKVRDDEVQDNNHFRDIVNYLREGDLLILNDTKVIPARLRGTRPSGGKCELLLLKSIAPDLRNWEALVKPARRIHEGDVVFVHGHEVRVTGDRPEGIRIVSFEGIDDFMGFLESEGEVPLPPYIRPAEDMRASEVEWDGSPPSHTNNIREAYQTVFAKHEGSAAAPTASLHFTPGLLERIKAKGVHIGYVTLHVGLGTFRPVITQDIRDHTIHSEHCEIPEETAKLIEECREHGGRVIASGTTAARTLEALEGKAGSLETGLYIYPGYKFRVVDALITNFHLPESSLIMLVSAFASHLAGGREEEILTRLLGIYERAAKEGWRFFSFGDAMFVM